MRPMTTPLTRRSSAMKDGESRRNRHIWSSCRLATRRTGWILSWAFLLVGAVWAPSCLAQRPAQGPMSDKPCTPTELGYELVWEDQFDGNTLDPGKWEVRGVGPRALGFVSPEAVKVENGYLKLSAFKKDGRILLGAVGTQGHFMTRYGYFECRAELQKSAGIWAAFWIQSPDIAKGEDPAIYGAEIDIMEFFKKLGRDIISHNGTLGVWSSSKDYPRNAELPERSQRRLPHFCRGMDTGEVRLLC